MKKKYQTTNYDEANTSIFRQLFEIQHELKNYKSSLYQHEMQAVKAAIDQLFERMLTQKDE